MNYFFFQDGEDKAPRKKRTLNAKTFVFIEILFFLSALGGALFGGLLPFVLGLFTSAFTTLLLIKKPTPLVFTGTIAGFVVAAISDFSYTTLLLFTFYLLPVIPLYLCARLQLRKVEHIDPITGQKRDPLYAFLEEKIKQKSEKNKASGENGGAQGADSSENESPDENGGAQGADSSENKNPDENDGAQGADSSEGKNPDEAKRAKILHKYLRLAPAKERTETVLIVAAVYLVTILLMIAVEIIYIKGNLSFEAITEFVTETVGSLSEALTEAYREMGVTEELIPTETINTAIQQLYVSSIGYMAVICLTLAYIVTGILRGGLTRYALIDDEASRDWRLTLSLPSAIVFIIICITYAVTAQGSASSLFLTAHNIRIVLSHVFMAYGFNYIFDAVERKASDFGISYKIFAIVLMVMFSVTLYVVLPICGLFKVLKREIVDKL